jgi:hypothetical protein
MSITFAPTPNFEDIISSIPKNKTTGYIVGWDTQLGNIKILGEYDSLDKAVAEVKDSQSTDLFNIRGIKEGQDTNEEVMAQETPCICYIFDIANKTVETYSDWIIRSSN